MIKNNILKKFSITLLIIMTLITALSLYETLSIVLISNVNDSGEYLYDISKINIYYSIGSLFTLYLIILRYKFSIKTTSFIIFLFVIWLLSGRRVAERMYLNCEISTGWYIIPDNHYYPCLLTDEHNEYSDNEVSQVRIKKSKMWHIEILNKNTKQYEVFIGPFAYKNVLKTLKKLTYNYSTHQSNPQKK